MVKQEILDAKDYQAIYDTTWSWMSEYIRRRDRGRCFTCPNQDYWKRGEAGHFIHSSSLDFDERAIHCQCTFCNRFQSGQRDIYKTKMLAMYGQEIVDEIERKAKTIHKPSIDELEKIKAKLKTKVKALRKEQD
jgi:hypothetical protein